MRERKERTLDIKVGALEQNGRTRLAESNTLPENSGMGLQVENADPTLVSQLEVSGGVMVTGVQASSAAARAGLLAGDLIVKIKYQRLPGIGNGRHGFGFDGNRGVGDVLHVEPHRDARIG